MHVAPLWQKIPILDLKVRIEKRNHIERLSILTQGVLLNCSTVTMGDGMRIMALGHENNMMRRQFSGYNAKFRMEEVKFKSVR